MTLRSRTILVRRHRNLETALLTMMAMVCIFGVSAPSARAQADPLESIGIRPVSAQLPVQNGHVDLTNGDLHLEIPLGTFAQRGGGKVKFSLMYDSAIWTQGSGLGWSSPGSTYPWAYGWRLVSSADAGGIQFSESSGDPCPQDHTNGVYYLKNFSYSSSDGTTHVFPTSMVITLGFTNKCGSHSSSYGASQAIDASGYYLNYASTGATVYSPSGEIVYSSDNTVVPLPGLGYAGTMDTNGNYITPDSNVAYGLVDTLGREPVVETIGTNTVTIAVLNSKGNTSAYTVTNETINVWTDFAAAGSGIGDYKGSGTVIQSITLPDGTSYSFGYDSGTTQGHYGQLTSMTLPTGGQISYSYATFDDAEWNAWGKHVTRGISTMTTPDSTVPWQFTPQVIVQCATNIVNCQQSMTVAEPSGDHSVYTFNINAGVWPTEIQFYNGSISASNLLATQTQTFDYSQPSGYPNGQAENVTKTSATVTLPLPGGTSLSRTTKYVWDTTTNDGNLKQQSEWNFYSGSLPTSADRITNFTYKNDSTYLAARILNRVSNVTVTNKNGATVSQTVNTYDGSVVSAAGFAHHNDANYGTGNTVRGNVTQVQRLISGTSNYVTTSSVYDMTGNVTTFTDPNGNPTTYTYTDNFFKDGGDSSGLVPFTPPGPTNAYPKTVTQGGLITTFGYYWGKGQKALSTDPNSQTAYFHFYDSLDRPTSTKHPDNGWTYSVYPSETEIDTGTGITSTTLTTNCPATSNACRHDQTLLDGLGRVTSKILVSDPSGQTTVGTAYDSNGRVQKVSNPYRSTSDSTYGWKTPSYDGLNRTLQVLEADGSVSKTYYGAAVGTGGGLSSQLCSSSTYGLGYPILSVDETLRKRQSWTDGFGRLIEVDEPNSSGTLSVPTCYSYDLNNNLTGVTQGVETRSFSYDLLSRLTTSYNPETNTIYYYYTTSGGSLCSGNPSAVCRRTDARSVTTTYAYDALNRLKEKSYSDSTHAAYYTYDTSAGWNIAQTNIIGRMTEAYTYSGGALVGSIFGYDPVGRTIMNNQCDPNASACQPGTGFALTYTYDLAGDPLTESNGFAVNSYQYNAAMLPTTVTSNYVDANHPATLASAMTYAPPGQISAMTYGNGLTGTFAYNNRMQRCRYDTNSSGTALRLCTDSTPSGSLLDLTNGYNWGSQDNGDVVSISATGQQTFSRSYTYDQVNRLATMSAPGDSCSGLSWGYDQWGNRTAQTTTGGTCSNSQLTFTAANQISNGGFTYDASGNLTHDANHSYFYDAENRIVQVDGTLGSCSAATACYGYDAFGRRVARSDGTGQYCYLYDLDGNVVSEWDVVPGNTWGAFYVYLQGRLLTLYSNDTVYFVHSDHLGSTRLLTTLTKTIYDSMDYLPFGEQIAGGSGTTHKFTSKERDSESGLDNFGARYVGSSLGRFLSPDWSTKPLAVPHADLDDPQTLNLYAYVGNNPLRRADPDGHGWWDDFKQRIKNGWNYNEFVTNAELPAAFERERNWLLQNARNSNGSALSPSQRQALQGASNEQINGLYQKWDNALMAAQSGEEIYNAAALQRAANGSFVPLTRLHSDDTITIGNSASYDFWQSKSTEEIIESLAPGSRFGELTVNPAAGTVMDGNTRIKILEERGVDVNTLPRVDYIPEPLP